MIQNQATADTKYDPYPPPRVAEKFVGSSRIAVDHTFLVSVVVIVLCLVGLLYFSQTPVRVLLILAVMWSIHYAVGKLPLSA
jgi:hypothetical protein